ncbi:MAG: glucosaminidase domain-containing protein, partial [Pseudomonadota bacterium]|nr:glucosaminidase domain-containing protein [Pseudomonadota bacterium]
RTMPIFVLYPGLLVLVLIVFAWLLPPSDNLSDPLSGPGASEQAPISVVPDFSAVVEIDLRKRQFFDFLKDYIYAANAEVLETRQQLKRYDEIAASGSPFSPTERSWVFALADEYNLDTRELSEREITAELMSRVDEVPVAMALAQAANESAWGTSRFAVEGNNIFGQWCFEQGCGLVPLQRKGNASYEVRKFDSISASVSAYIKNINSQYSYEELRELRARMRSRNEPLNAIDLAAGLAAYSERGEDYVDEVRSLIVQNELDRL